jgi:hypothetical protein
VFDYRLKYSLNLVQMRGEVVYSFFFVVMRSSVGLVEEESDNLVWSLSVSSLGSSVGSVLIFAFFLSLDVHIPVEFIITDNAVYFIIIEPVGLGLDISIPPGAVVSDLGLDITIPPGAVVSYLNIPIIVVTDDAVEFIIIIVPVSLGLDISIPPGAVVSNLSLDITIPPGAVISNRFVASRSD